jgi:hypothetical protein
VLLAGLLLLLACQSQAEAPRFVTEQFDAVIPPGWTAEPSRDNFGAVLTWRQRSEYALIVLLAFPDRSRVQPGSGEDLARAKAAEYPDAGILQPLVILGRERTGIRYRQQMPDGERADGAQIVFHRYSYAWRLTLLAREGQFEARYPDFVTVVESIRDRR